MAIKFSPNGLIRSSIRAFLAGKHVDQKLSPEQAKNVQTCLAELESLAVSEQVNNPGEKLIGPHVDLPVYVLFYERSMDPVRSAQLYLEIHKNIKHTFVPIEIYYRLPDALQELNVPSPDPELQIAVDAAINQVRSNNMGRGIYHAPAREDFIPRYAIEAHYKNGAERL